MKKAMVQLIKLIPVIIFLFSSVVHGQTSGKETLKGLKGVYVLVEELSPDIEEDGLRKSPIQTDVELKLRMAGIKVLTYEETVKEPGNPWLYVKVSSFKVEKEVLMGIYAFSIRLKLRLIRNMEISCLATTWHTSGSIGIVGEERVNDIRDYIKDEVDEFISDYLERDL